MKLKISSILALSLLASVGAAHADFCPFTSGNFNSTTVATINDGSNDTLVADSNIKLRVPAILPVKFSGGVSEFLPGQSVKFQSSVTDENGYCIATLVEVRPIATVSGNSNNKVRGGDRI